MFEKSLLSRRVNGKARSVSWNFSLDIAPNHNHDMDYSNS